MASADHNVEATAKMTVSGDVKVPQKASEVELERQVAIAKLVSTGNHLLTYLASGDFFTGTIVCRQMQNMA